VLAACSSDLSIGLQCVRSDITKITIKKNLRVHSIIKPDSTLEYVRVICCMGFAAASRLEELLLLLLAVCSAARSTLQHHDPLM